MRQLSHIYLNVFSLRKRHSLRKTLFRIRFRNDIFRISLTHFFAPDLILLAEAEGLCAFAEYAKHSFLYWRKLRDFAPSQNTRNIASGSHWSADMPIMPMVSRNFSSDTGVDFFGCKNSVFRPVTKLFTLYWDPTGTLGIAIIGEGS